MTEESVDTLSVVVEREVPYAPEKVWRALTAPDLIADWLMKNDFTPVADHRFTLRADWGEVACRVLQIVPPHTLSYSWTAFGLDSVVTWTLTPTRGGTMIRMEHSGFTADRKAAYDGAQAGWPQFLSALEVTLGRAA